MTTSARVKCADNSDFLFKMYIRESAEIAEIKTTFLLTQTQRWEGRGWVKKHVLFYSADCNP